MFNRLLLASSLIVIFLLLLPGLGQAQADGWEEVAPGIEYKEFYVTGPNIVFVTRLDRGNPNVIIESSLGQGRLADGLETVSGMAKRYDGVINYWGEEWGNTNQVVVAINGSGFPDLDYPDRPFSGMVHSGWYTKRYEDTVDCGGRGFAWTLERDVIIGDHLSNRPSKQILTHVPTLQTILIDGINEHRGRDELILYTPQFDSNTRTNNNGVEILVELERPTLVIPLDPDPEDFHKKVFGTIVGIRDGQGSTTIPFDHVVISARGSARDELLNDIGILIGDQIGINQEITNASSNCNSPLPGSLTKTYSSVSGFRVVLEDSEIPDFSPDPNETNRQPRTAVAYNVDYVYFIVVDGRHPGVSVGMNYVELGAFARDRLNAEWAINQDGGGSSTMWVNGHVVNNTYCNNSNCVSGRSEAVSEGSMYTLDEDDYTIFLPFASRAEKLQRPVANGLMMVVVQPKTISQEGFLPGDPIVTIASGAIRLGPGWNYPRIVTFEGEAEGEILPHGNGLNGVFATNNYWWKVSLEGVAGWVPESTFTHAGWLRIPLIENLATFFGFRNPVE